MKTMTGLAAGVFWALDTVILGVALSMTPFMSGGQAVLLAPFAGAFVHDFSSCLWMFLYTGVRRQFKKVRRALRTRSGRVVILGALLGGPVGMTGYVFSIRYLGASYTAMLSALFPALGAVFSYLFLKERLRKMQLAGLLVSLSGMALLGYAAQGEKPENFALGLFCVFLCVMGWASEVVICAWGMRDPDVDNEQALLIRQTTSALFHGFVILNAVKGWELVFAAQKAAGVIALSALAGTVSYLCYYKTIRRMGPSKAMALNITYSAWAIILEAAMLRSMPEPKRVLCGILILGGALATSAQPGEKV